MCASALRLSTWRGELGGQGAGGVEDPEGLHHALPLDLNGGREAQNMQDVVWNVRKVGSEAGEGGGGC